MFAFGAIGPRIAVLPVGATPKLLPREKYIQRLALINMRANREGWDTMRLLHRMHTEEYDMRRWLKRRRLPVEWAALWSQQYRGLELWRNKTPWQIYQLMWEQAYQRTAARRRGA